MPVYIHELVIPHAKVEHFDTLPSTHAQHHKNVSIDVSKAKTSTSQKCLYRHLENKNINITKMSLSTSRKQKHQHHKNVSIDISKAETSMHTDYCAFQQAIRNLSLTLTPIHINTHTHARLLRFSKQFKVSLSHSVTSVHMCNFSTHV